jgi:hypothetical protein
MIISKKVQIYKFIRIIQFKIIKYNKLMNLTVASMIVLSKESLMKNLIISISIGARILLKFYLMIKKFKRNKILLLVY